MEGWGVKTKDGGPRSYKQQDALHEREDAKGVIRK